MTRDSADVVIVGAGIAGCATAYYLAKAGVKSVLVDRDGVARHASGFAYGGLYPLSGAGIPGPMFPLASPLAKRGFSLHRALAETLPGETGIDVGFRLRPTVGLAFSDAEGAALRDNVAWVDRQAGFRAEWLSAGDLRDMDDRIAADAFGGALYRGAAEVDPEALTRALLRASGAALHVTEAIGLMRDAGRVAGVRLADGDALSCGTVILAQGPWAGSASGWLGVPIDVQPLKGEILRLEAAGPPIVCSIGWRGNYATTKPDGLLWVGTTEDEAGFDDRPTAAGRAAVLANLARMLPGVEPRKVVAHTACLRPMSGDGYVVLGAVPNAPGVFVATGGGRKGILHGPAMGAACADLVVSGETDLDLTPYGPGRFRAS